MMVFPASAGMIRVGVCAAVSVARVPRIRGDDPLEREYYRHQRKCSLHPRG